MFKNQLQELAQRSCFNLPSYACIREGPDHAPRFKASVNFNGEIFASPNYCSTLRQAEHAAAEVALNVLSTRGPSRSLTARVLDETGVYKNLLQETAHRAGLNLPVYTTVRSGPGHLPVFTCTVKIAGMNFTGVSAKTKKQAEKNAAIAAWSDLKRMPDLGLLSMMSKETDTREEEDQMVVSRILSNFRHKDESKQVRKGDQNRARRRMVKGYRDNSSASSSTSNYSLQFHQWSPMDLLMDSPTQKQNSFLTLLPPPPPRTTSKILAPTSSRDSPSLYQSNRLIQEQMKVISELKTEEVPPPLEDHQRDEEEWLGEKPDIIKKTIEKEGPSNSNSSNVYRESSLYRPFPLLNFGELKSTLLNDTTQHEQTYIRARLFGSPTLSPMAATSMKPHSATHMARPKYTGGFHPHRIAPAVQIRSVIPVCAAPPAPLRTQPSNHPTMGETSSSALGASSSSSTSSVPTHTGAEVSSTSSKFNKLQL
ncbi:hypothetical protein L1049_002490 [Liquidambar formosana]|uniref:DRBM domain-containing protein n=1 Tax=Liquidambar formosana TaxID=63359 RepID=A0AAP0NHX7_LIQFO